MAGRCYTELKQPKPRRASASRTRSTNYNDALVRENALYLSWLAEDYIQLQGEIDHTASIAKEVLTLAGRTNSARTDDRLQHLARLLKPYADVQADFLSLYREIAA